MERSEDWLNEAQGDLEHAKNDLQDGYYNWACFSAQQSAQKAVKAVFQRMHLEAWGHSVADLLKELSSQQEVPDKFMDLALELDKAYILARYPNAHPSGSPRDRYTKEEAKKLIKNAEEILQFCSNLLSQME